MKTIKIITAIILLAVQCANTFAQSVPPNSGNCVSGNCVNGNGKMIYENGTIYEGDFVNGSKEGQGTFTAVKLGIIYTGGWKNNKRNGYGKEVNKFAATELEGTWKDNVLVDANTDPTLPPSTCVSGNCVNGKGKMLYENGETYEGDWVNENYEGQGTYKYENGSYFTGKWKDSKPDGYGKYYDKATNSTKEGIWKAGIFVK